MSVPGTTDGPSVISALIVDPKTSNRLFAGSTLAAAGFRVTVSNTFASAKDRMAARPPRVLVTEAYLAEYNGIHLVIRGTATDHKLAAIVTCDYDDPVLREAAEKLGATFVVKPLGASELTAAVLRTLFRSDGSDPIRAPFERRVSDRRSGSPASPVVERRARQDRRRGLDALRDIQRD